MGDGRGAQHSSASVNAQGGLPSSASNSLYKWAVSVVNGATDRSARIISKVLQVSNRNADIAKESTFLSVTNGRESWTQVKRQATHYDSDAWNGLQDPV